MYIPSKQEEQRIRERYAVDQVETEMEKGKESPISTPELQRIDEFRKVSQP